MNGETWAALSGLLSRTWPHAHGVRLTLAKLAIDTGFEAAAVYAWGRAAGFSQVVPVKGVDGFNRAASVTGTRDQFTLAPPATVPQTTHALVVNVRGRRTDVRAKAIRPLVRVNSVDNMAADLPLSNQTTTLQHAVYRNPDGGGLWTGVALANVQIGIEAGA